MALRYEIKYVFSEWRRHEIVSWIKLHPWTFVSPYPMRCINNIYFDSYGHQSFIENITGASSRTKVRFRWYGNENLPIEGALEIKKKRNFFGWKETYAVSVPPSYPTHSWRDIRNAIRDRLPAEGREWLSVRPYPVIINRYFRQYFVSNNWRVRVTVDHDQQVYGQELSPNINIRNRTPLPQAGVIEFKFDPKDVGLASEIMQSIPLRVSRHSKYVVGMHNSRLGL